MLCFIFFRTIIGLYGDLIKYLNLLLLADLTKTPSSFWENIENLREVMTCIGERLGITSFVDWYLVSVEEIKQEGKYVQSFSFFIINRRTTDFEEIPFLA